MLHAGSARVLVEWNSASVDEREAPVLLQVDVSDFNSNSVLHDEVFGPAAIVIHRQAEDALPAVVGSLAASVYCEEGDHADPDFTRVMDWLRTDVAGRLVFNGVPTGVRVCTSMVHGGPYPATTDSRATSVGAAAIYRWARPVCFQNFPTAALPAELQDGNPLGIWRKVEGKVSKE